MEDVVDGAELSSRGSLEPSDVGDERKRPYDELEIYMADILHIAQTGESIIEPMRTRRTTFTWDDILIKGAQLVRIPLDRDDPVNTETIVGPGAEHPLVIQTPIYITHMSFGALSREVKVALGRGSAAAETAMCSGEGGILPESLESAYRYIFEYVPNEYSVTEDNLKRVDAIEIKIGQSAKPGMGGHLPGRKVSRRDRAHKGVSRGIRCHQGLSLQRRANQRGVEGQSRLAEGCL
jgi:glutamate synthase domain-containing protein 2